jgi:hypothetical protein
MTAPRRSEPAAQVPTTQLHSPGFARRCSTAPARATATAPRPGNPPPRHGSANTWSRADGAAAFVVEHPGLGPVSGACGICGDRPPGPPTLTTVRGHVFSVATDPEYRHRGYAAPASKRCSSGSATTPRLRSSNSRPARTPLVFTQLSASRLATTRSCAWFSDAGRPAANDKVRASATTAGPSVLPDGMSVAEPRSSE